MASIPRRDLQRDFLTLTRKGQETVVHAIKAWAEIVGTVTPKPFADRLRSVSILRTPEEALADAYRLAERLVDSQRKLAEDLLRATVPLLQGSRKTAAPEAEVPQPQAEVPQPQAEVPQPQAEVPQPQAEVKVAADE